MHHTNKSKQETQGKWQNTVLNCPAGVLMYLQGYMYSKIQKVETFCSHILGSFAYDSWCSVQMYGMLAMTAFQYEWCNLGKVHEVRGGISASHLYNYHIWLKLNWSTCHLYGIIMYTSFFFFCCTRSLCWMLMPIKSCFFENINGGHMSPYKPLTLLALPREHLQFFVFPQLMAQTMGDRPRLRCH